MMMKNECSSVIHHQNNSVSSPSWSDMDPDMLREIDRKLDYGDHIRMRGVCKNWRAAGGEKRPGDVLPWWMAIDIDMEKKSMAYTLYEPPSLEEDEEEVKSEAGTFLLSGAIDVSGYFMNDISNAYTMTVDVRYVDGWLHISLRNSNSISKISNFLFYSLATKASFALPQFNHFALLALSSAPDSPDCVFLAMSRIDYFSRLIGVFRHGDTNWTVTQSNRGWFGIPRNNNVVFIRGSFYFLLTGGNIASYDLATGRLAVDSSSTKLQFSEIHSFFGLDGDLMLAYIERETWRWCIRRYDWSDKDWVPLQSIGTGRSLYLSGSSIYVDHINYYGISSSASKIYLDASSLRARETCVDEYTLEDGQLSKCVPARPRRWRDPGSYAGWAIWAEPPDVLLRR